MTRADIVIVGAGPAGMAAASVAADLGADVLVLDEQAGPGGQIYRSIEFSDALRAGILGEDYAAGGILAREFAGKSVRFERAATVWRVDPDGVIAYSRANRAHRVRAGHVILATGAQERPVPLPGWTLPGIMTAGAAQIMLKSAAIAPRDAVLAGSGPLLYLLADQLIRAGVPPRALIETQTVRNHLAAARHLPGAVVGWRAIAKGMALLRGIRAAGVERFTACREIRLIGEESATGDARVAGIAFVCGTVERRIACSTVLLHQGVVPNTQITRSLRLDHVWDDAQRCFRPVLDAWGASSNPRISVAGDGASIGGAKAAEAAGRLAALDAALRIGVIDRDRRDRGAGPLQRLRGRELAVRPFLDALYAPPLQILQPVDETIVCRCEEVTAGAIRGYAKLGCVGPNQTKAFGRCGMGPCQGRFCGLTVTEILAMETGLPHGQVGAYRIRAPIKPVTLGEIASLAGEDETDAAGTPPQNAAT